MQLPPVQPPPSLLAAPERHPLLPPETVARLGVVVVAAPHPDDEALGCGGLLALLAARGQAAHVLFVTDGSRSHPTSPSYPAPRLAALREGEAREAVARLGLPAGAAHFLRHPDCGLPAEGTAAWEATVADVAGLLDRLGAETVVVPWRRDPHCDHVATWGLFRDAAARLARAPLWLEYPVWAWPSEDPAVPPLEGEAAAWRLDVRAVLEKKNAAVAAHRSQTTRLIDDDPEGFMLSPEMLARFRVPWELYLEPREPW